MSLKMG
jgi:hypothetical protein